METPLEANVHLASEKIQFTGVAGHNPAVTFDYTPPLGDGKGYTPHDVQKAMDLSEKTYCPVWAMLKNNVEILPAYTIIAPEEVRKSVED